MADAPKLPSGFKLASTQVERVCQIAALLSDLCGNPNIVNEVRQTVDWDAVHEEIHQGPSPRCPICEWNQRRRAELQ